MNHLRNILLWSCAAVLCGCGNPASNQTAPSGQSAEVAEHSTAVLLDVRSAEEYGSGHLQGALNIPHDRIVEQIGSVAPDRTAQIILYCRSGRRADTALNALKAAGYENVSNYGGLEDAGARLNLPVVTP